MERTIKSETVKKELINYLKKNNTIETLIGEIKLLSILGEGGNGVVFEGIWKEQPVAIKFYCNEGGVSGRKFKRFVDEIAVQLFSSDSKYLAKILYFNTLIITDDFKIAFFIMPKYDKTLKQLHEMTCRAKVEFSSINQLFYKLCQAVEDLHSRGIVHRDLKPENIFLHEKEIILGDLGICYFDNDIERNAETKKGERLANYLFSAPEQVTGSDAHETMDIFSIGQILHWYVFGETHRGTYRKKLSSIDEKLAAIDKCIEKMLSNDVKLRPQSIEEAKEIVSNYKKESDPVSRAYEMMNWSIEFDRVLRMSFPGKDNTFFVSEKKEINNFMENLKNNLEKLELWWTVGEEGNNSISRIKQDGEHWILGYSECIIKGIFIHRTPSVDREYVLIWLAGDSPFENVGSNPYNGRTLAAKFKDAYITAEEHDDGYAIIEDNIVALNSESELRERFLEDRFLFVAPNSNSVLFSMNDALISDVLKCISSAEDKIKELERIKIAKANRTLSIIK